MKTTYVDKYKIQESDDGNKYWYVDDMVHREDGPAIETVHGDNFWYINGQLHREGGPAIECINGDETWCIHGKYHREDGPAFTTYFSDGVYCHWYLNGDRIKVKDNDEFLRLMKLRAFL